MSSCTSIQRLPGSLTGGICRGKKCCCLGSIICKSLWFHSQPLILDGATVRNTSQMDQTVRVPAGERYVVWNATEQRKHSGEEVEDNPISGSKLFVSIRRILYREDWFVQRQLLAAKYPHYKLMLPLVCRALPEDIASLQALDNNSSDNPRQFNLSIQKALRNDESCINWVIHQLSRDSSMRLVDSTTMLHISRQLRNVQRYRECLWLWKRWEELVYSKEEWQELKKDTRQVLHELILCYSAMGVATQVGCIANLLSVSAVEKDHVDSESAAVLFDIYTNETHVHLVNVIKAMQLLLKCPLEKQTCHTTWLQLAKAMVSENPLDHGKWALLFINHLDKKLQVNFFNHFLSRLSRVGRHDMCLDALEEMKMRGLQPDECTVAAVMRAFTNSNHYQKACEIFERMQSEFHVKYGDTALSELLIAVSRDGQLNSILGVLDSLLQLGHVPSDAAIRAILLEISYNNGIDEALATVEFIARRNVFISSKVLDLLLLVAKNSGEWKYAKLVFWLYSKHGKLPNFYTFELLMRTLTRHCRGERMINRVKPDHPLLSSDSSEAARILADLSEMYRWMLRAGVFPTAWIVREMIRAAASGGHPHVANQIFFYATNVLGIQPTEDSFEFLVNAYAKVNDIAGVVEAVRLMKDKLGKPSLRALNIWMRSCLRVNDIARCQQVFEEIVMYGYEPNEHTFACLIAAAGREGKLQRGHELLRKMMERGLFPNSSVYVTLLKAIENCTQLVPDEFVEFLFQGLEKGDWQPDGYLLASLVRIGYRQQQFSAVERVYRLVEKHRANIAVSQLQLPLYELVKGALSLGCSCWAVDWIAKFALSLNVRATSALRYAAIYEWLRLGVVDGARDAVVCTSAEAWKRNNLEHIWLQVWKELGEDNAATSTERQKPKNLYPTFLQRVRQAVEEKFAQRWQNAQNGHVDMFWTSRSKEAITNNNNNMTSKDNAHHPLQRLSFNLYKLSPQEEEEQRLSSSLEEAKVRNVLHTNLVHTPRQAAADPLIVIADMSSDVPISRWTSTSEVEFPMKHSQSLYDLPGAGSFAAWNIYIETCLIGPLWLRPLTGRLGTDDYILRRYESVFSVYSLEAIYAVEYLENSHTFVSDALCRQVLDRIAYLQRWKPNRIWGRALEGFSKRLANNHKKEDSANPRWPFRFSGLYE
jgi:pentatricopeptide repeat protein